jgi:hypothetical protein
MRLNNRFTFGTSEVPHLFRHGQKAADVHRFELHLVVWQFPSLVSLSAMLQGEEAGGGAQMPGGRSLCRKGLGIYALGSLGGQIRGVREARVTPR